MSLERTQLKKEVKTDTVQIFQSHQLWRKVPMDAEKRLSTSAATGRAQKLYRHHTPQVSIYRGKNTTALQTATKESRRCIANLQDEHPKLKWDPDVFGL